MLRDTLYLRYSPSNSAPTRRGDRAHPTLWQALALSLTCVCCLLGIYHSILAPASAWADVDITSKVSPSTITDKNSLLIRGDMLTKYSGAAKQADAAYRNPVTATSPQGVVRSTQTGYGIGSGREYYVLPADYNNMSAGDPLPIKRDESFTPRNGTIMVDNFRKRMFINQATYLYTNTGYFFEIGRDRTWKAGDPYSITLTYPRVGTYELADGTEIPAGMRVTISGTFKQTVLEGNDLGYSSVPFTWPAVQVSDLLFGGGYIFNSGVAHFQMQAFNADTGETINLENSRLTFCSQNTNKDSDATVIPESQALTDSMLENVYLPTSKTTKIEYINGTNMKNFATNSIGGQQSVASYPTSMVKFGPSDYLGGPDYLLNSTTFYQDGSFDFYTNGIGWWSLMSAGQATPEPEKMTKAANKQRVKSGDSLTYTLTQPMPQLGSEILTGYASMQFRDVLDPALTYSSAKMYYVDPDGKRTDVTSAAGTLAYNAANRTVTYNFKQSYLDISNIVNPTKACPYEGGSFVLEIATTVGTATKESIPNTGYVRINDVETKDDAPVIYDDFATLEIKKSVDFEHGVGDKASYTIEVTNPTANSIARNVVISDRSLPSAMAIDASSVKVTGVPAKVGDYDNPVSTRTEGSTLTVSIPRLPSGNNVKITFDAACPATVNGQEVFNSVTATLDNPVADTPKTYTAKDGIWVNSGVLDILKRADKFEYRIGDTVTYTVSLKNTQAGTIAKNIELTDSDLPDRVRIDASSIKVTGVPATIAYNIDGNGSHKEENRDAGSNLSPTQNGFTLKIPYLPADTPVVITYTATATADSNALETMNSATATFDNPTTPEQKFKNLRCSST